MDNLSLILQALAVGTAAGLQQTTGAAIKDASDSLIALLKRKLAKHSKAQIALVDYKDDPSTHEKTIREALVATHIEQDEEVLTTARELLTLIQIHQADADSYTIHNAGTIQGQIMKNDGTITMNF